MPTPRPHYKERIAHAEGYEIQSRDCNSCDDWEDDPDPIWNPICQYRVKPEPKPDVVLGRCYSLIDGALYIGPDIKPNLRLTFDGETGKLKAAEVI